MKINISCNHHLKTEIEQLIVDSKKQLDTYTDNEKRNLLSRTNFILESLFKNEYGSFLLPWEFVDSELGKKLIEIKYKYGGVSNLFVEKGQEFFTTTELGIIRGVTRQAIAHQIREGNIQSASEDKRTVLIPRTEVINHLCSKLKITYDDAKKIVEHYESIKNSSEDHDGLIARMSEFKKDILRK